MKQGNWHFRFSFRFTKSIAVSVLTLTVVHLTFAQGYGSPLTMQGLNHISLHSIASRAAGGISFGLKNNASTMFANPASLQNLEGIQFSLGGMQQLLTRDQQQQWFPLRYLPTFSLMMEGLLDSIPAPDLSEPPEGGLAPEDSIFRAFDKIKPNWSQSKNKNIPLQIFAAAPLKVEEVKMVVGIGVVEYANLDYYFQNNNVLSPSIGTQRPYGVPLPIIGQEVPVMWSSYKQARDGSLMGYGGAISVNVLKELSIGMSGLLIDGSTDDAEFTSARGRLRFGNNNNVYYYKVDSLYSHVSHTGTSNFSGMEYALSSLYTGRYISLSVGIKLPTVITREFKYTVETDTTGTPVTSAKNGKDQITLPWRGSAGISLSVRSNVVIGIEYELLPFADAEYKKTGTAALKPWLSSTVLRFGMEYVPADRLALRAGYAQQAEVFAQEGTALVGEPVSYSTYSIGGGLMFANIQLNVAYEYSQIKYQDMWQTNINLNNEKRSNIIAGISYMID